LGEIAIFGKFSGATGTYGADHVAYPEVDWQKVCTDFVSRLGFVPSGPTTQIEPHDYQARFLSELALANTQMIDLARDIWQYISDSVFRQSVKKDEVSSSTMPHKVNPIDFENAEANFGLANALAFHLVGKLPISRLQRDLTDSSAQRALGEVFGHTLIAQKSLQKGLGKITPNEQRIATDLEEEWSVLTEAIQTVMRKNRVSNAYDITKKASRGQEFNKDTYVKIVNGLDIPDDDKKRLLELTPATYTGKAAEIAKSFKYRS
jgi:adenylosuccinate lyase